MRPARIRERFLTAALVFAFASWPAVAEQGNDAQRLALNAYLKCWIATYSKLHNSTGTYAAIDAANAACERQFQALAVVTNISEAGSVMIQVMEAAKSGNLDNLRPPEDSSKAKPRRSDPATDWPIRPTLRSNS